MAQKNYTIFHLHSDQSNGTTNIDSVTKYGQYIEVAKSIGMKAMGFSEHGNIFEWFHKKTDIEAAGMKYIHACECYITESLDEKVRDNYHCVLIARNYDGFKELNKLISKSFNRKDGHFYYVPRVLFDELLCTSENIIVTTACLGGILNNGNELLQNRFLKFLKDNKHRCFLEIQHHCDAGGEQKEYNKKLYQLSNMYHIPLIAGTDTHALNREHMDARSILQKSKKVHFGNEDDWDLELKTYDELCIAYKLQGALPESAYLEAIENTNKLADMVEVFDLDRGTKYPKLYDDSYAEFKHQIDEAWKRHPYIKERYPKDVVLKQVLNEIDVYDKVGAIDFMLLQNYLRNWEHEHDIFCGPGRGSVSGSLIAYILGITEMDSKKFGLNFFRFMNPSRVTNADVDTDYSSKDRDTVKKFILKDHMNIPTIKSAEIITFNTIKMKGAIKDVGRALGMTVKQTQEISDVVDGSEIDEKYRHNYPELFKYVDLVVGVIVSVGSHPSGVLVSDLNIDEEVGLCSLSTSDYPVSMLNMKELDELMYVKLDILGLDNVGVINETCKLAGIPRAIPDNTDLNDEAVWKSIRNDTTCIFQWESNSAQSYLKRLMSDETIAIARNHNKNFSYIKWFSFGNGLLRPGCASFRDSVANGEMLTTGFKELDEFLSITSGRIVMQEDIMRFLVLFCGYSNAESDSVRRGVAKKYGTERFIDEIHDRFIEYSSSTYKVDKAKLEGIFPPIKAGILDASSYAFSWNHSDAYSCIGYICGYLRYYYPYEFITAALNIFEEKEEKTASIIKYAMRNGINIQGIKFRYSKAEYMFDKKSKSVYKGMASIKYLNKKISDELYALRDNKYESFIDLLEDIHGKTSTNSRQLDILIKLDYFSEFGSIKNLIHYVNIFNMFNERVELSRSEVEALKIPQSIIDNLGGTFTEKKVKGVDMQNLIRFLCGEISEEKDSVLDKISYEKEFLGYINLKISHIDPSYAYVTEVNKKFANKTIKLYRLNTGDIETVKVKSRQYEQNPIEENMIIQTINASQEKKWRPDGNGGWKRIDELETILHKWRVVK